MESTRESVGATPAPVRWNLIPLVKGIVTSEGKCKLIDAWTVNYSPGLILHHFTRYLPLLPLISSQLIYDINFVVNSVR